MGGYSVVVKNGNLVIPGQGVVKGDVGITGEVITALGQSLDTDGAKVIDAEGKYIFPGAIDPHVHLGMVNDIRDDFGTESRASVAGGITSWVAFIRTTRLFGEPPPQPPQPSYRDFFPKFKSEFGSGVSYVDFAVHFAITSREEADRISEYYRDFGVQSYKFYMAYKGRLITTGVDVGLIYYILRKLAAISPQLVGMCHAEYDEIVTMATEEVKQRGEQGLSAWSSARPKMAEELAIRTVCFLARKAGATLYIPHVSCKDGMEAIAEEQAKGTRVTAETCPHFLGLTTEIGGVIGKTNPPIRGKEDQEALWEALKSGLVASIGTDHVAMPPKYKEGDIWTALSGFPGLETMMPVMITEATRRGVTLDKIAEVCSANTARTFGLWPKKGTIQVGSDADLAIIDLNLKKVVSIRDFLSSAKFSPFEGREYHGWPVLTMLRGQIVYDGQRVVGSPRGQYMPVYPDVRT